MAVPKKAVAGVPKVNRERVKHTSHEGAKDSRGSGTYSSDLDFYKPAKGVKTLRILPYIVTDAKHPDRVPAGELWWRRPMKVHFGVGPEEKARVCLTTIGQKCPVCTYAVERKKSGEATDEEIKMLKPKDRDLFLVMEPSNPDEVLSMEVSFHNFTKKLFREIDEDPDSFAGFADLVGGLDLKCRFVESSMGKNKFIELDRVDFAQRKHDNEAALLDELPKLDDCINVLSYEELEAEFYGASVDEDEAEPPKASKKTSSKPAPKQEDEEAEEDETEEEEVEPEEDDGDKFDEMDRNELKKYIKSESLEIKVFPSMSDDDIRAAIRKVEEAILSIPEDEPEEEEPEEEEEPAPKKPAPKPVAKPESKPAPKKTAAGKCASGGTFGESCNIMDECETCDAWEDCQAEFDRMAAEKRAAKKKK